MVLEFGDLAARSLQGTSKCGIAALHALRAIAIWLFGSDVSETFKALYDTFRSKELESAPGRA